MDEWEETDKWEKKYDLEKIDKWEKMGLVCIDFD